MIVGIMAVVAQAERKMISARTKAALAAAKARGQKLDGLRPNSSVLTAGHSAKGAAVRSAKAEQRAMDLAPVIAELRAEGVTSLGALARALTQRHIPTAKGLPTWTHMQVSRVLAWSRAFRPPHHLVKAGCFPRLAYLAQLPQKQKGEGNMTVAGVCRNKAENGAKYAHVDYRVRASLTKMSRARYEELGLKPPFDMLIPEEQYERDLSAGIDPAKD